MKLVTMVCVVLACARVASAQPAKVSDPTAVIATEDALNPGTAFALSLGGTAVSWGLLIASLQIHDGGGARAMAITGGIGTLVAPSFGHWYAHSYLTRAQGVRLVSVLVAGIGFAAVASSVWDDGHDGDEFAGTLLLGAGSLGYVTATLYDLATAGAAAERWNARSHRLAVVPMISRATDSYGLALGGRF